MSSTLMVSVSGIRGIVGTDLTPELITGYAAAFGSIMAGQGGTVVLARDARTSGPMFAAAAMAGLQSVGVQVIDCGLIPTPTAQLAVEHHHAGGGIILTASHNPVEWNALKFVGPDGVFLSAADGAKLVALAESGAIPRGAWNGIGATRTDPEAIRRHIDRVLALRVVDVERIRKQRFTVALDCVRGAGGTIMPALLQELGCTVSGMDLETDGRFPRAPEPLPENLKGLGDLVRKSGAAVGIAVDPDVDRLALVDETGRPIGEDYTLAFGVEAVLARGAGPVVVNLSTSLVVDDAARPFGVSVTRAPVGEANVARAMRDAGAIVGGEGNGGVMLPELHLGRDAPLAAALVLDALARSGEKLSALVSRWPRYAIVKAKAPRGADMPRTYAALERRFADAAVDRQDGRRMAWADRWLHVRPSGTEPIVRLIAEARTPADAQSLVQAGRDILENGGAA